MGRDITVVCTHACCEAPAVRAIISAENIAKISGTQVRFALKPAKTYLFDAATQARIVCDLTE